ncbi:MAG TPA: hypothetical protein ENJ90_08530 [Devosia sp.]|nr:hypothetical protein [Devosia sp.]
MTDDAAECACPDTYPAWDGRDLDLGGTLVHTLPIPTFFHMPVGYESYLQRQQAVVEALELEEEWPRFILTRTGFFRGSVTRLLKVADSPARNIHVLPTPYNVHVVLHHGNVSTARRVLHEMQFALVEQGRVPKELYMSHLTCPRCSERKGGDKIMLIRRWEENATMKKRLSKER